MLSCFLYNSYCFKNEITVNRCDLCTLAGNEKRIVLHLWVNVRVLLTYTISLGKNCLSDS